MLHWKNVRVFKAILSTLFGLMFGLLQPASATLLDAIKNAPTSTSTSLLRGAAGSFGASRGQGKTHAGVDIVANQGSQNKFIYAVYATGDGDIAYAKLNGSEDAGYGYTVVIDHGNGYYTQYSHLATNASRNMVRVGESVVAGKIIGYLADLANNEKSSGNVRADVVQPYDKIQLHFEVFKAPRGRSSTGQLSVLKAGATLADPTSRLQALGYNSF